MIARTLSVFVSRTARRRCLRPRLSWHRSPARAGGLDTLVWISFEGKRHAEWQGQQVASSRCTNAFHCSYCS